MKKLIGLFLFLGCLTMQAQQPIPNIEPTIVEYKKIDTIALTLNIYNPEKFDINEGKKALEFAKENVMSDEYDIVILDEVGVAISMNVISVEPVLELIKNKPEKVAEVYATKISALDALKKSNLQKAFSGELTRV